MSRHYNIAAAVARLDFRSIGRRCAAASGGRRDVRWLNPGSPTSLRLPTGQRGFPFRRGLGTVGLLQVEGDAARFEVVPVDDG